MSKKTIAALLVSIFMAANVFAADADKTIAVVNGEPIFTSEFNEILLPVLEQYRLAAPVEEQTEARVNELKTAVLNQKIEENLLKQEVKNQKIKVARKEIQDGIDQIKKRFANETEFNAELKKEKITMADFEKRITEQLAVMKLVRQSVESKVKPPKEDDVKKFYDQIVVKMKGGETSLSKEDDEVAANLAMLLTRMSGEQVRLRQIFINIPKTASAEEKKAAEARVDAVKKALRDGSNFADTATKYSEDAISKARAGDIGIVVKGDLQSEIDKLIFTMNVGEYTKEPVRTDTGYHFLRVEEKRASKKYTFDEVKNDIAEVMYQNDVRKTYMNWVESLKSKSEIKINKSW